ncbi:redoxin domain-containing protein [bacterium]|nr:MAG: redoxin domain-containing protein [bacterium]
MGTRREFVANRDLPKNFRFALDPDYALVNAYGLRWDAPHETAYPSTFVVGRDGRVGYAKISASHGDRAPLLDVLAALDALQKRR